MFKSQFKSFEKALVCGYRLGWVICVQESQNTQLFRCTFLLSLSDFTKLILQLYLCLCGIVCGFFKELVDLLISDEKVCLELVPQFSLLIDELFVDVNVKCVTQYDWGL